MTVLLHYEKEKGNTSEDTELSSIPDNMAKRRQSIKSAAVPLTL